MCKTRMPVIADVEDVFLDLVPVIIRVPQHIGL